MYHQFREEYGLHRIGGVSVHTLDFPGGTRSGWCVQIWFIGRTLASQAGKAGSTPVICFIRAYAVWAYVFFCIFFCFSRMLCCRKEEFPCIMVLRPKFNIKLLRLQVIIPHFFTLPRRDLWRRCLNPVPEKLPLLKSLSGRKPVKRLR